MLKPLARDLGFAGYAIYLGLPEKTLSCFALLPALARLIIQASQQCQVWVVSHASRLIAALQQDEGCNSIVLEKVLGETRVVGQGILDAPAWHWPE